MFEELQFDSDGKKFYDEFLEIWKEEGNESEKKENMK